MTRITILGLSMAALLFTGCSNGGNDTESQKSKVTAPRLSEESVQQLNDIRERAMQPIREADMRMSDAAMALFESMREKHPEIAEEYDEVFALFQETMSRKSELTDQMQIMHDQIIGGITSDMKSSELLTQMESFVERSPITDYNETLIRLFETMQTQGIEHPVIDEVLSRNQPVDGEAQPQPADGTVPNGE